MSDSSGFQYEIECFTVHIGDQKCETKKKVNISQ